MSEAIATLAVEFLTGAGAILAAFSLFQSLAALRARSRAHEMIARRVMQDKDLKRIRVMIEQSRPLSQTDIAIAQDKIASLLKELPSQRDREYVFEGLRQSSAVGAASYLSTLLRTAA
jgi:hypothetical protein